MITRLLSRAGERIFDGEIGAFVDASAIPCHRCGVCCERWQPPVTAAEIDRLAAHLGLDRDETARRYTRPYPFDDEVRLLARADGGCVFLAHDQDGRSRCTVHGARPDACRDWVASLDRRECVDGLRRFGPPDAAVESTAVYPDAEEHAAFLAVVTLVREDAP